MRLLGILASITLGGIACIGGAASAQETGQPADFLDNAPTDPELTGVELLRIEETSLIRLADRIIVSASMTTPEPGSYRYDPTIPEERWTGPEVFTGWLFTFNHPEHCVSSPVPPRCGPDDFNKKTGPGVFNIGAHVSSIDHHGGAFILDEGTGGHVVISGEILVDQAPLPDPGPGPDRRVPLTEPMTAEVHLAIVSHGQLNPSTLPGELYAPSGFPGCQCWWLAMWTGPGGA